MTRFDLAFDYLMGDEGGYSDNPHDPGGATNWGVTQRSLDAFHGRHETELPTNVKDLTKDQAKEIYRIQWWSPQFDKIKDERIAIKIFSHHVNTDDGAFPSRAVKLAQEAVNEYPSPGTLVEDGVIGPKTLDALNTFTYWEFAPRFKHQLEAWYVSLNNPYFLRGWLVRIRKDPS